LREINSDRLHERNEPSAKRIVTIEAAALALKRAPAGTSMPTIERNFPVDAFLKKKRSKVDPFPFDGPARAGLCQNTSSEAQALQRGKVHILAGARMRRT